MSLSARAVGEAVDRDPGFGGDVPLVRVYRGPYVNAVHRGVLAVADAAGLEIVSLGDTEQPVFLRSAAKPFQVMPAVLSDGIDRFGITERELAVLCSSHSAEPMHTECVFSVLTKIGLGESALHCGVHLPMDEGTARRLVREGRAPGPIFNNCSGAHAGMLVACVAEGWPIETYEEPGHPLQIRIRSILAAFAGVLETAVGIAVDNCAVPTFRIPVANAAQAFARLATGKAVGHELGRAAARVTQAMTRHPEMVGGSRSWDTSLMRAARGRIVCKGGADGFQGIGDVARGLGLAVRMSDGSSDALPPAVIAVLDHLHSLDAEAIRDLESYRMIEIRNHQHQVVGRMESTVRFESPS